MFTLSAKGVYGLTAVLDLAQSHNRTPVQIKDIADGNGIPQHYLEQLLVVLKKSGIVDSYRGSQGGYMLARSPNHISVLEVLTALDGKLEIVPEPKRSGSLSFYWSALERTIKDALSKSLDEIITERQMAEKHFVYHI